MAKDGDKYKEEIEEILDDAGDLPPSPSAEWRSYRPLSEEIVTWYKQQQAFKGSLLDHRKCFFAAIFFFGLFALIKFYIFALIGLALFGASLFLFLFKSKV